MKKLTPPTEYPQMVKDVIDEQLFMLVGTYLDAGVPFRLILTPEDKWDKPLPDSILEQSDDMMVLDIEGQSLDDSYYNVDNDTVYIVTGFEGEAYYRSVGIYDVMGIVDLATGTPVMIKPYDNDHEEDFNPPIGSVEYMELTEAAKHSWECMKKNNPALFKK